MMKMNLAKRLSLPVIILSIALILISVLTTIQLNSMIETSDIVVVSDEKVETVLMKTIDHINWVMDMRDSIDKGVEFTGEADPRKCGFGEWMYSEETQNIENPKIQSLLTEVEPYHNQLHESLHTVNDLVSEGKSEEAVEYYKEDVISILDNITVILEQLKDEFIKESTEASQALYNKQKSTTLILIIVSILSLLGGVTVSTIVIIKVVRYLREQMCSLAKSAAMVSSASTQLNSAGQQLAEGSNEQAASIEETSAVMDETSSMVKQNAENTRQANNLSKEATVAAEDGSKKVVSMTSSMEELKKSSSDIAKIIKVIDEIAFQTNMLALNAAVEAARAGDAGQGFAVVAEEVRNLAQKSAQAAKDTAEIIDKNIELSEQGAEISASVSLALDEIMSKTKDVNMLMDEITAASDEQAKGTSQVTEAIGQMEQVVQQNAATAQESAASAEELKRQSLTLENIVNQLDKMINNAKKQAQRAEAVNTTTPIHENRSKKSSSKKIVEPNKIIPLDCDDDF